MFIGVKRLHPILCSEFVPASDWMTLMGLMGSEPELPAAKHGAQFSEFSLVLND